MSIGHIHKTVYKVSDFLSWQRTRSLDLSPNFQRRQVWSAGAKSYFLDTIIRGLPVPILFLRERTRRKTLEPIREVVDGQQRLRTLVAFIDRSLLADGDLEKDSFSLKSIHNAELADRSCHELPKEVRQAILNYEFSTHVLPSDTEDRDILQIFARMNATGVRLNGQELRNAEYFGAFKEMSYALAYEQLERWRRWAVFSETDIARMKEVEETSDLIVFILAGVHAKTQQLLNAYYKRYDEDFKYARVCAQRFRAVLDSIEEKLGQAMAESVFSGQSMFDSLFSLVYERLYGTHELGKTVSPKPFKPAWARALMVASDQMSAGQIPDELAQVLRGASTDKKSREVRLSFLRTALQST